MSGKEIQNTKADVTTQMQRSPRSVSYFENHYSSESKQSLKKPGSKVSFLRQSSDSPTFLTAPTTGEPCSWQTCSSAFHCAEQIQSKVQVGSAWEQAEQGQTCFRKGPSCISSPSWKIHSRVQTSCFSRLKIQWKELLLTIALQKPNTSFVGYRGFIEVLKGSS